MEWHHGKEHTLIEQKPIQGLCHQIIFSINIGLGMFLMGYALAFTSPALYSMKQPQSTLHLNKFEETMVGGMMPLGGFFGSIAAGPAIRIAGRRLSTFLIGPPLAAGWLLISFAFHVAMVYVGRVLVGFFVGMLCVCMAVYLSEGLQPELRGFLGLVPTTIGKTGILVCYLVGKYTEWRLQSLIAAICVAPSMVMSLVVPESPHWYLYMGKREKGEKALRWLRGGEGANIEEELLLRETAINEVKRMRILEKDLGFKHYFQRRYVLPVGIGVILMMATQAVGYPAVIFYCADIFRESRSQLPENDCAIIIGAVNVLTAIVANVMIDSLGRRQLLNISCAGTCITSIALGLYFLMQKITKIDEDMWGWVPLTTTIVFIVFYQIGLGPIPWLVLGEILPGDIRSPGAAIALAVSWVGAFLVTWLYPLIAFYWGLYTAFWIFAAISFLTLVFGICMMPETRGRTLEDIEREMQGLPPLPTPAQPEQPRLSFSQKARKWSRTAPTGVRPTANI